MPHRKLETEDILTHVVDTYIY